MAADLKPGHQHGYNNQHQRGQRTSEGGRKLFLRLFGVGLGVGGGGGGCCCCCRVVALAGCPGKSGIAELRLKASRPKSATAVTPALVCGSPCAGGYLEVVKTLRGGMS